MAKKAKQHGLDVDHPEYTAHVNEWRTVRDCIAGQTAIKAGGDRYLPKLDTDNANALKSYTARAVFYGATGRTLDGYLGSVFRKPPQIDLPDSLKPMLLDIDGAATTADQFIKTLVSDVIAVNRAGILLDLPVDAVANALPYLCYYPPETIRDWRQEVVKGRKVLTFLVLQESEDQQDADGFGHVVTEKRRVYRLIDGKVTVELWARSKDEWIIEEQRREVTVRSTPLESIPFWFFSDDDLMPCVKKSAMLDLANVNVSHYQNTTDLEHGAHYTALPTPWIAGINSESKPDDVILGPTQCIMLPEGGEAGMLEFTGAGLKALETRLQVKEQQMAILGARLLEAQKTGVEAADTHRLRQSADTSILAAVVGTCNIGLEQIFRTAYVWAKASEPADDEIKVAINDEFFATPLSGQEVLQLVQSWQAGGMSRDSLLRKLQKGGVIERSPEEEVEQMESEGAMPAPGDIMQAELDHTDAQAAATEAGAKALAQAGKNQDNGGNGNDPNTAN